MQTFELKRLLTYITLMTSNDELNLFENVVLPEYADVTERNMYILRFCYAFLCQFQDALTDREKNICEMLLVQNNRNLASAKYSLTAERVRQLFISSIKKISESYQKDMKDLSALRKENEELKEQINLLENASKSLDKQNVEMILEAEKNLCSNAIALLKSPIKKLPLSARAINVLKSNQAYIFKDIPQLSFDQLKATPSCGKKTITEISDLLSKLHMDLGMKYEDVVYKMLSYNNEDLESIFTASKGKKKRQGNVNHSLTVKGKRKYLEELKLKRN